MFNWPLMSPNAITQEQREILADFILSGNKLTYGEQIRSFEDEFCEWNDSRYSVFVNSGSSANLILVYLLKLLYGKCHIITNSVTWSTNVAPVIQLGHELQLCDAHLPNLGLDLEILERLLEKKTSHQKVVFITHVLGFNGISDKLSQLCKAHNTLLIEDCCEAMGTSFQGTKVGNFGLGGTFSSYYAHHITSVEGGIVTTDDDEIYKNLILLRSHGLTRELPPHLRPFYDNVDPKFTFALPGFNVRNVELHALLAKLQLKNLNSHIVIRNNNFNSFLENCPDFIYKQYNTEGMSNFAIPIILNDVAYKKKIIEIFNKLNIEFRPIISGNLYRQPFIQDLTMYRSDKTAEIVHNNGFYIGNHQDVSLNMITSLCQELKGL